MLDPTTLWQDHLSPFLPGISDKINIASFVASTLAASLYLFASTIRAPSQLVSPSVLVSIVAGTNLDKKRTPLQRVYKASNDGWSAIAFHDAVDGMGSGVLVARGITGVTFGGYNPNGWRSTDDYYGSTAALLWCLQQGNKNKVVKLPVLAGGNCAVLDYAASGPCFGAADLVIGPPQAAVMGGFTGLDAEDITKSAGNLRQCRSAVGSTYDYHPAWPVRGPMQLVEVEIYCSTSANALSYH